MTNKEKCIKMWEMIKENCPEKVNSLYNESVAIKYRVAHNHFPEARNFSNCYACLEAEDNCSICPISWTRLSEDGLHCFGGEYGLWVKIPTKQNAEAVIQVIKKTWKE